MRDIQFLARLIFALTAIVLILGVVHNWDDAETEHVRVSMRST